MAIVEMYLEEGFFHDTVEIWGGTARLARLIETTTNVAIGLAAHVTLDVPDGVILQFQRGPDHVELTVDPLRPHIGVSATEQGLISRFSDVPFPRA